MAIADEISVLFRPQGLHGRFPLGTTVLEAARVLGVDLAASCSGRGYCGRCQIEVDDGGHAVDGTASAVAPLAPQVSDVSTCATRHHPEPHRRLACQTRIIGDVTVHVPADSQVQRPVIVKELGIQGIRLHPVMQSCYLEVPAARAGDRSSDLERVRKELATEGFRAVSFPLDLITRLPATLQDSGGRLSVFLHRGTEVVDLRPGFHDRLLGVALDVGTTTLAGYLSDLTSGELVTQAGVLNPQVRFGDDVITRLAYLHQQTEAAVYLRDAVRAGLNQLLRILVDAADVEAADICAITLVGNTVMHHLLFGLSAAQLGVAPFTPVITEAMEVCADQLELACNPLTPVYALPCIGAHVGADAAAALLALAPQRPDATMLVIDIGTNAEVVLFHAGRILAASAPTGPAFEGGQLECGCRATSGAIERVRINPSTGEAHFKVVGCDVWSDHETFQQRTRHLRVAGLCGSGIIEAVVELHRAGLLSSAGRLEPWADKDCPWIVREGRTFAYVFPGSNSRIRISQADVRAVQLAKAALGATINALMSACGVTFINRVVLTGGFGVRVTPEYAIALGLVPTCVDVVESVANAAGLGALVALLDAASRQQIEELVQCVEKVETAAEPSFQERFVRALKFPEDARRRCGIAD